MNKKDVTMIVNENQELQQYKAEMEIQITALNDQLAEAQSDAEMQHEIHVMLIEDAVSKYEKAQDELADVARQKNAAIKMGWKNKTQRDELRAQLDEAKSVLVGQREDRRFDRKRLVKIAKKNRGLLNELNEVKSKAWKTVDLEEGNMLVFVGVHVVAWQQEWGQPAVGFSRWNDDD